MEIIVDMLHNLEVKHILGCICRVPEIKHDHFGIYTAEFHFLTIHVGKLQVRESGLISVAYPRAEVQHLLTSFCLYIQSFHIFGLRIYSLQRIADISEMKSVSILAEHRNTIANYLIKHRYGGQ